MRALLFAPPPPRAQLSPRADSLAPPPPLLCAARSYVIAGLLYSCVGILGYIGFADAHTPAQGAACAAAFPPPPPGGQLAAPGAKAPWLASPNCTLSSDFLANFGSDFASPGNVYAFSVRISLLLQLFTVFPILLLIIRNQFFKLFVGSEYPSALLVAALNAGVLAVTYTFAALDLQIGAVLSYVGAIGGFVIVFAVPVGMEAVALAREARGGKGGDGSSGDGSGGGSSSSSGGGGGGEDAARLLGGAEEEPAGVTLAALLQLRLVDRLKLGGILCVGFFFFIAQFLPIG